MSTDSHRNPDEEAREAVRHVLSLREQVKFGAVCWTAAIVTGLAVLVAWLAITDHRTLDAVQAVQQAHSRDVIQAKRSAQDAAAAARSSTQLLTIVKDCLTPGTPCSDRSAANTQKVLSQVGRIYTYAGLCLANPAIPQNTAAQETCVARLIKEHGLG